jgi:2-oxoglutarate ferredoxin oxidoreductase subunit beta
MKGVYDMNSEGYTPDNMEKAFAKAWEWGPRIPLGIFYKEERATYSDELPQDKDVPVALQPIDNVDIKPLLEKYY